MNAPLPGHEADLEQVLAHARAMLDDEVRADPARWQALVHPDFFQFGFGGSEIHFDDLHDHLKPLRFHSRRRVEKEEERRHRVQWQVLVPAVSTCNE